MSKIKKVENNPNFPEIEDSIIEFWEKNKIFQKSIDQRSDKDIYRFIDGPPFVSGNTPHYGSLLPSIAKDIIPRYWSMKGKKIQRVFGWDCHGLPIEEKINKKLNIKKRDDIEKIGVDKYIAECRNFVEQCTTNWKWYIQKVGRWVDMDNAYYTMDIDFMESVVWGFSEIYKKGYIYKGERTSLYSTDNTTPVSNFEVSMDQDNYKDVEDLSIFVKFEIQDKDIFKEYKDRKIYAIAWTTTAWTIPSNFALAISEKLIYALVEYNNELFILAKKRILATFNVTKNEVGVSNDKVVKIIKEFKGKILENISYKPIYDYFVKSKKQNDFKIYTADFVKSDEGTGIVHIAPGFGEDDFSIGKKYNLSFEKSINEDGDMVVGPFKGVYLRDATFDITNDLEKKGDLLRSEIYTHRLPFYRGEHPLIYMSQSAYFIDIQKVKSEMLELAKDIHWIPSHIKNKRFKYILESSPDWCISRNRYWATIIPIWESADGDTIVIDSIEQITKYTNQVTKKKLDGKIKYFFEDKPFEFHKDICDKIILKKNGKEYKRVPEVLDVWMDSGSVPFAEYHYPFENKKLFKDNPESDYVIEYIGQVRAWFNVLLRVSTLIFDKNAFKNAVCTGVLSGTDGRKMSKSYGNYPDPKEVLENIGGEALRLYLMSSPIMLGEDMSWSDELLKEQIKNILLPLWNTYKYFTIYAQLHNFTPNENIPESTNILDTWILTYMDSVNKKYQNYLDNYIIPPTIKLIQECIDTISSWYIRRSRDRFVRGDINALSTLYKVIVYFIKIFAPQMPFITERIYQDIVANIENNPQSIHLVDYPKYNKINKHLLSSMDSVRKICSLGQSIRVEKGIKVRQPLSKIFVPIKDVQLQSIIKTELNIKEIKYSEDVMDGKHLISKEEIIGNNKLFITMDIEITDVLKKEGIVNDLIRSIQDIRKSHNLKISQLCNIYINTDNNLINSIIKENMELLLKSVNAKNIKTDKIIKGNIIKINDIDIEILIQ